MKDVPDIRNMAASMVLTQVSFLLIILNLWRLSASVSEDEFDSIFTLPVEHSFESGSDAQFTKRGFIMIKSVKSGEAYFTPESPLTDAEKLMLKELADKDGYYRLRIPTRSTKNAEGEITNVTYVSTFLKACALYESALVDEITLNIDQSGNLLAVALTTSTRHCRGDHVSEKKLNNFKTSVNIIVTKAGPVPDTQTYVERMEKEKKQKEKGQQQDNRSFFAKYWMYIVPVFIFLMFSGSMDPQGGNGGGGGGGGGGR